MATTSAGPPGAPPRHPFLQYVPAAVSGIVILALAPVIFYALGHSTIRGNQGAASRPAATAPASVTTTGAGTASVDDIARAATDVPARITRTTPAHLDFTLTSTEVESKLDDGSTYTFWTFDNRVPGPMLRVMQGDTVTLHVRNANGSHQPHSIDLHAVTGPGGGSMATQTTSGGETAFSFRAMNPGLYIYHCATPPAAMHIANGMYGMILVEPPGGLPAVDREYYVMQGEYYTAEPHGTRGHLTFSNSAMMAEQPTYYVFNGRAGALMGGGALHAKVGETVRIFFGVGTFKPSAFHVIGTIFDTVYPDGSMGGPVERNVGVVNVPAGGTTIAGIVFSVPGTYTIVDHALPRVSLGAAGQIVVDGPANPSIFDGGSGGGSMAH